MQEAQEEVQQYLSECEVRPAELCCLLPQPELLLSQQGGEQGAGCCHHRPDQKIQIQIQIGRV